VLLARPGGLRNSRTGSTLADALGANSDVSAGVFPTCSVLARNPGPVCAARAANRGPNGIRPCVPEIAAYFDISAAQIQIGCVTARNLLMLHKFFLPVP
jgi:hypothetical protein